MDGRDEFPRRGESVAETRGWRVSVDSLAFAIVASTILGIGTVVALFLAIGANELGMARGTDVGTKRTDVNTFELEDVVNCAFFSRDASRILTWSDDEAVLSDITNSALIQTFYHNSTVNGAQVNKRRIARVDLEQGQDSKIM